MKERKKISYSLIVCASALTLSIKTQWTNIIDQNPVLTNSMLPTKTKITSH